MRINDYNQSTFRTRKGLLWLMGTIIHYSVVAVTTVLSLMAAFVIFMGLFEMDFSSWSVWWKSADYSFTGVLFAFAVGMVWSFYNKIRKCYLNAYLDSGAFGVIILTLKSPFLIFGALLSLFFEILESDVLDQCIKRSKKSEQMWKDYEMSWWVEEDNKRFERM